VQSLCAEIERIGGLTDRVIAQTERRVLQGGAVPVAEKLFSLFEPHTDLIVRGKARTPAEFGHKVLTDLLHPAAGPAGVIDEPLRRGGQPRTELPDQARKHADPVPQQRAVGGIVDVGFHHGGVHAQPRAVVQAQA
jgi:hypothetical protein